MVLGKKVAIFDWEWAETWPLEMGRKGPDTTAPTYEDEESGPFTDRTVYQHAF